MWQHGFCWWNGTKKTYFKLATIFNERSDLIYINLVHSRWFFLIYDYLQDKVEIKQKSVYIKKMFWLETSIYCLFFWQLLKIVNTLHDSSKKKPDTRFCFILKTEPTKIIKKWESKKNFSKHNLIKGYHLLLTQHLPGTKSRFPVATANITSCNNAHPNSYSMQMPHKIPLNLHLQKSCEFSTITNFLFFLKKEEN